MTTEQKTIFLKALGYTIETINYVVEHDGGRSSHDWTSDHSITVVYKTEPDSIKEFKSKDIHYQEIYPWSDIGKLRLSSVFQKEYDEHILELLLNSAKN